MEKAKGKPKRSTQRRWMLRILFLICAGIGVLLLIWRTPSPYIPVSTNDVHYSPDGRFFVEMYPIDIGAGGARISDGWRATTHSEYHGGQFFGWSSDSRYAVIVFMQHYGVSDLGIFDTHEWRWYFANDCDMFGGSGSACDSEMPLATNGRYLLLQTGKLLDLTGDLPANLNDKSRWLGVYPDHAKWSPIHDYLAVVGFDKAGNRALHLGSEDGYGLHAVMPFPIDLINVSISWRDDESAVIVTGEKFMLDKHLPMPRWTYTFDLLNNRTIVIKD